MDLASRKFFFAFIVLILFFGYFVIYRATLLRIGDMNVIIVNFSNQSAEGTAAYRSAMFRNVTLLYKHDGNQTQSYPVVMQPNLSEIINWTNPKYPIANVKYLIENQKLCSSVNKLNVLVVVNSAPDHSDRRQAMRETWTTDSFYSHLGTVRVLFLLGKASDNKVQSKIEEEFQEFKDILQGDFVDTYYNITHKGVMGYKWLTERCRNAEIILKTDDDFIVNMFIYFRKIRQVVSKQSINVYCDYKAGTIFRNTKLKWGVSNNHFRGQKHYKHFCKGKFVSMTNDIIPSLYISATQTPFYPFDDVLLYGYVMHNVPGLKYQSLELKDMEPVNTKAIDCLKKLKRDCTKFVIGASGIDEMKNTWNLILKHFGSL